MDIKRITQKKKELELEIAQKIIDFNEETGTEVKDLALTHKHNSFQTLGIPVVRSSLRDPFK